MRSTSLGTSLGSLSFGGGHTSAGPSASMAPGVGWQGGHFAAPVNAMAQTASAQAALRQQQQQQQLMRPGSSAPSLYAAGATVAGAAAAVGARGATPTQAANGAAAAPVAPAARGSGHSACGGDDSDSGSSIDFDLVT